jgi:hypothetical protein
LKWRVREQPFYVEREKTLWPARLRRARRRGGR